MKNQSKNIFLAITLCVTSLQLGVALAQEVQPTMVDVKEVSSSQNLKKQRQNKSLALHAVKRNVQSTYQNAKQFKGQYLLHGALPSNRLNAK